MKNSFQPQDEKQFDLNLKSQQISLQQLHDELSSQTPKLKAWEELFRPIFPSESAEVNTEQTQESKTAEEFNPTLALIALDHAIKCGRFVIQDGEPPKNFFVPLLAPEVFGNDLLLDIKAPEKETEMEKTVALASRLGSLGLGTIMMTPLYVDRYSARAAHQGKPSLLGSSWAGDKKTLFGLVERVLAIGLVKVHRYAVGQLSYKQPGYLVMYQSQQEGSPWVFNPVVCDPLFARLKLVDDFFNAQDENQVYVSQARRYLQQFDESIIQPIDAEIKRLREEGELSDESKIKPLDFLLSQIREVIHDLLKKHFDEIEAEHSLKDEIKKLTEGAGKLEEYPLKDNEITAGLHKALCGLLRKYAKEKAFIVDFVEPLKNKFFDALHDEFMLILQSDFENAKRELSAYSSVINLPTISKKIDAVLLETNRLEASEKIKPYGHLTEALRCAIDETKKVAAGVQDDAVLSGVNLQNYARRVHGRPSLGWKLLGGALMALGVVLMVVGILFAATTLIPTFGLSSYYGYGIAAGGFGLVGHGARLFYRGRQKGLSASLNELGKELQCRV